VSNSYIYLLTESEKQLLMLAAAGHKRSDIANFTHKSVGTVDKQMSVIMKKLKAANIVNAVAIALRGGII